jgi:hypothetical protein
LALAPSLLSQAATTLLVLLANFVGELGIDRPAWAVNLSRITSGGASGQLTQTA